MSDYELWSEVFDAYYGVVSQLQILTWNFLQPLLQFGIVIFALVLNAIYSHIFRVLRLAFARHDVIIQNEIIRSNPMTVTIFDNATCATKLLLLYN